MAYKKIYTLERNHITIASGSSAREIIAAAIQKLHAEDVKELPTYSTFVRRFRLYQFLELQTSIGNKIRFLELKHTGRKKNMLA